MTGWRRPRRASWKGLAIGLAVFLVWFAWAYRDALAKWAGWA